MARFLHSARPVAKAVVISAGCAGGAFALRRSYLPESDSSNACRHLKLNSFIAAESVRELETAGFIVLPNAGQAVLGPSTVAGARRDAHVLQAASRFAPGSNRGAKMRGDTVCWLCYEEQEDAIGSDLLQCMEMLRGIAYALEQNSYRGSHSHCVPKLQQLSCYPAGAAAQGYARHLDCNLQSIFDLGPLAWLKASGNRARVITAILYLNDDDWGTVPVSAVNGDEGNSCKRDGGELRLFHGPKWFATGSDASAGEWRDFTDIEPRGGTLVIFNSRLIEHQVFPTHWRERFALTCWVGGQMKPSQRASSI
eukprot:TRINITY_DN49518_c0_g1_i1.p1 TRINITY_DN49518_c0_g1~~TRINITY_DN49518_c0_g1_i1.p1  ORF type:complete len:310 (-),score=57.27 TRINITY_DN49518_c0_g1_i1:202-1131(-)